MKHLISLLFITLASVSVGQNALDFDGTNDEVQTTYTGVLGAANRTFEAWIFVSPTAPASNLAIIDYGLNAVGARNTFFVSGTKQLSFISGGTNANIGTAANAVPVGQWAHVAFVLSSGTGYLYVNGVQQGTGNLTTVNTPSGNQNVIIGERVSGGSIRFKGSIDEVRIWDVARSIAEINADMNYEYCAPPTGLKANYKLNEGTAGGTNSGVLTAVDAISANNGTLSGFALTGATSNWVTGSGITIAPVFNNQNVTQCPGTTFTVGSNTYSIAGTYNDTLLGQAIFGCDSVIITNLAYSTISNDTLPTSVCAGDSVTINGTNYYFSNGYYSDTLISPATGCDSIVTLNLTVYAPASSSQSLTECEGFTLTVGSNTYSASGMYIDTLTNSSSSGCDSIVTTNLTIQAIQMNTQNVNLCDGESISVGSNVYSFSGNYIDTLAGMAANGCDSIVTTNLAVAPPINVAVSNATSTFTISANNTTATSYQWINCTTGVDIAGATGQSYVVTTNGSYAVVIGNGNCSDTSACTTYSTIGIDEKIQYNVLVYPNPSSGIVTISNITDLFKTYDVYVLNLLGQTVYSKKHMSDSTLEIYLEKKGVYFVEIESGKDKIRKKLIIK